MACESNDITIESLLRRYQSIIHTRKPGNAAGGASAEPACCAAAKQVLQGICTHLKQQHYSTCTDAVLHQMVMEFKDILGAMPMCVLQDVDWDGTVIGYKQGKKIADPCLVQTKTARAATSLPNSTYLPQLWLHVFLHLTANSKKAAKKLYSYGIADILQTLSTDFTQDKSLTKAIHSLWAKLAQQCGAAADEMVVEGRLHGLLAIASEVGSLLLQSYDTGKHMQQDPSHAQVTQLNASGKQSPTVQAAEGDHSCLPGHCSANSEVVSSDSQQQQQQQQRLLVRVLYKLAQIVRTCSGASFAAVTRPGGILAKVYDICTSEAAIPPDIRGACGELVLACVDRARQLGKATATQAPCVGWFGTIDSKVLMKLEDTLRHPPTVTVISSSCAQQFFVGNGTQAMDNTSALLQLTDKLADDSKAEAEPCANSKETDENDDGYDSDGLRVVYASGPTAQQHEQRVAWQAKDLSQRLTWTQTSDTVDVWLALPPDTTKHGIQVDTTPHRLTISLAWAGRVVDGPLPRRIKAKDTLWVVEEDAPRGPTHAHRQLHVVLTKDEPHYWRSLFEGSAEKSHLEVLQEAVNADERTPMWDELDPEAKELVEELRDRQYMVSNGMLGLENSFDDFRLVIGDSML